MSNDVWNPITNAIADLNKARTIKQILKHGFDLIAATIVACHTDEMKRKGL